MTKPHELTNNTSKQRVVVICPGRGTYNKEELGYFHRYHNDKTELLKVIDDYRTEQKQITVAELDQMQKYSMRIHTSGENASSLIYACALADYYSIDQEKYDIVAVTGNSMGWYIALAVAGALDEKAAIELINTMGSMMKDTVIGGQIIYPIIDENWGEDKNRITQIEQIMADINQLPEAEIYTSIKLGGYIVFGGNELGLKEIEQRLPVIQDKYPMKLFNHAAFHTPLLKSVSVKAKQLLSTELFSAPRIPLIDGQGKVWQTYSTEATELHDYTLEHQVISPYDYSKAIEVAIKEFAPDKLIILGPGTTLGGATAQCLIKHHWLGFESKQDFIAQQKTDPYILAMGMAEQRDLV